jgi:hypothetical protein
VADCSVGAVVRLRAGHRARQIGPDARFIEPLRRGGATLESREMKMAGTTIHCVLCGGNLRFGSLPPGARLPRQVVGCASCSPQEQKPEGDLLFRLQKTANSATLALGWVRAKASAIEALIESQQCAIEFLTRHVTGDPSDLDEDAYCRCRDDDAVVLTTTHGRRVSVYRTSAGRWLWVVTVPWKDGSVTTIGQPHEEQQ